MKKVCMLSPHNGGEFSLCGDAFDLGDNEPGEDNPRFAEPGDLVTCEDCREVIDVCRALKRYRFPKEKAGAR